MGLFLWLIILLAIAWGVADFQLQSRVEAEPQPAAMTRPVTAALPPQADVAAPVADAPGSTTPASNGEQATAEERLVPAQDTQTLPPVTQEAQR
jgi:hypothetical protein